MARASNMTKEEAALVRLRLMAHRAFGAMVENRRGGSEEAQKDLDAIDWAIATIQSKIARPQPDPDTGLMPCGCGGNARIKHDSSYSSKCIVENAGGTVRYETSTVEYPGHTHAWVDCDNEKCKCSVGYSGGLIFKTDEEARDAWNVAMGYNSLKTNPCDNCIGPMLAITHGYKNMKIREPEVEG
jgi:hypothetical protein